MKKEEEYKEIFLAEALDNYEELNRLLTELEKNPASKPAVDAIFRITHTLKGNAAGMGFSAIAELSHTTESLFGEIRDHRIELDSEIFTAIFKAIDVLGSMIHGLKEDKQVRYKGVKTRLEVIIKRATEQQESSTHAPGQEPLPEPVQGESQSKNILTEPQIDKKEEQEKLEATEEIAEEEKATETKIAFSDLVQVPVRKLDNLLNLVGELIIERDRIMASQSGRRASSEYARLNRISSDLQYSVMDVRLVQVGFLFNKFHRVVRDAAALEQKQVALKLEGTDTEIDRNILQTISDSLIHLIRNAVAHGIETVEERKQQQKGEEGTITLRAYNESDTVIIEIIDDGKGIDTEKVRHKAISKGLITKETAAQMNEQEAILLIFEPGFSTVENINAISGRGVGMDVVKQALDTIGGMVSVDTAQGVGTTIRLSLPSSMAVKGTLLFELNQTEYAIPLTYTDAVVSLYKKDIHKVGKGLVATHLKKTIAIVFLNDLFKLTQKSTSQGSLNLHQTYDQLHDEAKLDVVVVNYGSKKVGFVVDKLLQQKEIVEKPLAKPVDKVKFVSGITILGNGHVCLVLHVPAIIQEVFQVNVNPQNKSILS
ncbi:chemotaxis protein CheA [Catalinimonas niigatensis]|uniref:chemotaxis protein CheA n=1 Tax=Catalinimonas niigatensis TaxID=1397264 RepID=UPI002666BAE0|nr:chemotaxis protein CheA [Catalinimonas niigatensis]WPP53118.1 chemotaxis protein CheA [Catalinimonas niigatensis]